MTRDSFENNPWQLHSEKFLEMAFRTDRREVLGHPDAKGQQTGQCGDTVAFYLLCRDNCLQGVSYDISGCINTNACANAVIELIEGKTVDQAWGITADDVSGYLESLSPDHFHCAELAVGALYLALADLRRSQRQSWKRPYR